MIKQPILTISSGSKSLIYIRKVGDDCFDLVVENINGTSQTISLHGIELRHAAEWTKKWL